MVDGINTIGAGNTVARVIQQAAPPPKREGGTATENAKATRNAEQSQAITNLLKKETKESNDFISQAEAILNKALSLKPS